VVRTITNPTNKSSRNEKRSHPGIKRYYLNKTSERKKQNEGREKGGVLDNEVLGVWDKSVHIIGSLGGGRWESSYNPYNEGIKKLWINAKVDGSKEKSVINFQVNSMGVTGNQGDQGSVSRTMRASHWGFLQQQNRGSY